MIGILITAIVLAGLAAIAALVTGLGWWFAFLIYALGGAAVVLAFAGAAAFSPDGMGDMSDADYCPDDENLNAQARSGRGEADAQHAHASTEVAR